MKRFTLFLALSLATAAAAVAQTEPSTPPPTSQPPPPPASPPPTAQPMEPNAAKTGAPPPATSPVGGEWVNTTQYGWVWVPYDQQYTHVIEDSGLAYEFVYYPAFGWRWVVSPWVLGIGPRPYFFHGPDHFAWYAHPWFRYHPFVHREVREFRGFRGGRR